MRGTRCLLSKICAYCTLCGATDETINIRPFLSIYYYMSSYVIVGIVPYSICSGVKWIHLHWKVLGSCNGPARVSSIGVDYQGHETHFKIVRSSQSSLRDSVAITDTYLHLTMQPKKKLPRLEPLYYPSLLCGSLFFEQNISNEMVLVCRTTLT